MFLVISVYFNLRNILLKSGTFLPGHPVYIHATFQRKIDNIKWRTVDGCLKHFLIYAVYKDLYEFYGAIEICLCNITRDVTTFW